MKKKILVSALLLLLSNQNYANAAETPVKPPRIEAEVRSFNSALLYVLPDGTWQVGSDTKHLVNVRYANFTKITDDSFNLMAIDAEKAANGGYVLFLQNLVSGDIYWVDLDATGTAINYKILTTQEIYKAETTYNVDLNLNGGIGSEPVIFSTGEINTYVSGDGKYQVGKDAKNLQTIVVDGKALNDLIIPNGWEINKATADGSGYRVFLSTPNGSVYSASLNSKGIYTGGKYLSAQELEAFEAESGLDLNSDSSTAAPEGWQNSLSSPYLQAAVNTKVTKTVSPKASTESARLDYTAVVALLNKIIVAHQNNSPLTAAELTDLRAIAARGKAAFIAKSTDDAEADYLAYIFDKLVNESKANNFWTGGGEKVALGNLTTDTSIENFKKLVDKWFLGKDLPSTKTAGDTANPAAAGAEPKYAKASGPLFVDGINQADVAQGTLGDCYLVANVLGVADVSPARIKAMIVENPLIDGNRTWGVRFFDTEGKPHWVTVNDMFTVDSDEPPKLNYGANQEKLTTGELWWPIVEKAYVQANTLEIIGRDGAKNGVNAFWAIEGGTSAPLGSISGVAAEVFSTDSKVMNPPLTPDQLKQKILDAFQKNQPVYVGSGAKTQDAAGKTLLTSGHAFMILNSASNSTEVTIRNPWTLSKPSDNYVTPFKMSLDELAKTPDLDFGVGAGF